MFGYDGENQPIFKVTLSDVSDESDAELITKDEEDVSNVLDPSNPQSHGVVAFSRKETDSDDSVHLLTDFTSIKTDNDTATTNTMRRNSVTEVIESDEQDSIDTLDHTTENTLKISCWLRSRFMVSRKDREKILASKLEELPIEPLNDHILSDFGSRYRGSAGNMLEKVGDVYASEEESSRTKAYDKFRVGPPLNLEPAIAEEQKKEGPTADRFARKGRENRYFVTNLSTKCHNCKETGHISSACPNKKLRPCYLCGLTGHSLYSCPSKPCSFCLQIGHESKKCKNRQIDKTYCQLCARTGHDDIACQYKETIRCMVCMNTGHMLCVPIPAPPDDRKFCPNCTRSHDIKSCRTYRESEVDLSSLLSSTSRCYICNEVGHIAATCSQKVDRGIGSCYECGDFGHHASDCRRAKKAAHDYSKYERKRPRDDERGQRRDDFRKCSADDRHESRNARQYDQSLHRNCPSPTQRLKRYKTDRSDSQHYSNQSNSSAFARLNRALETKPSSYRTRR